jgi:uncharacterized membrane-anchored protein YitT (DUF2179 family)
MALENDQLQKEIHFIELSEEEQQKIQRRKTIKSYLLVMLGTLIYSVGVVWILRIGGFFSGGATGASQLIVGLFEKFSKNKDIITTISNNLGTFILLINIPLFVIGWRGLSKKFVLLTAVSIVLQTVIMNLLSKYTISPLCLLINDASVAGNVLRSGSYSEVVRNLLNNDAAGLIDIFRKSGFTIIKNADTDLAQELFKTYMSTGTRLLLAIIGGIVCGSGAALCLKAGGSTGGMDIIANYLQVRKQVSFTKVQTTVDTVIICSSAIISVENVLFTIIRLLFYMRAIDTIYKIYKTNRIEIITTKGEEMRVALLKYLGHGVTLYKCVGGYTMEGKDSIVVYAYNFETPLYVHASKEVVPNAFVTVTKTKVVRSKYVQKTIV